MLSLHPSTTKSGEIDMTYLTHLYVIVTSVYNKVRWNKHDISYSYVIVTSVYNKVRWNKHDISYSFVCYRYIRLQFQTVIFKTRSLWIVFRCEAYHIALLDTCLTHIFQTVISVLPFVVSCIVTSEKPSKHTSHLENNVACKYFQTSWEKNSDVSIPTVMSNCSPVTLQSR